jgi:hypothetical protein
MNDTVVPTEVAQALLDEYYELAFGVLVTSYPNLSEEEIRNQNAHFFKKIDVYAEKMKLRNPNVGEPK